MKCKECGKKFSIFAAGADALDLCPECAKKSAEAAEKRNREQAREALEAGRANRPPLRAHGYGGKNISARGKSIVLEAEGKTTILPIRNIQRVDFEKRAAEYSLTILPGGGSAPESIATESEIEASFLSDIMEYIACAGEEEKE